MNPVEAAVPAIRVVSNGTVRRSAQEGKIGWILLWLVGIPVPVLLALFLLRGCT